MANTQSYSISIDANTRNLITSVNNAQRSIDNMNNTIRQSGNNRQAIQSTINLRSAVERNAQAHAQAQQNVDRLTAEINNSANPTRQQVQELNRATTELNRAGISLNNNTNSLRELERQTNSANQSTNELIQREQRLLSTTNQLTASRDRLNNAIASRDANRQAIAGNTEQIASTVGLAMSVAEPIKAFADFEQQMLKVKAVSGASSEEFEELNKFALKMGSTTRFSASQSAEAMENLARAGFNTTQTMQALPAVLQQASANGIDLALSSDIVAKATSQFELGAKGSARVVDVYSMAASKANISVEQLNETMKFTGPVAKAMGSSLEQTVAMTAMLGNIGIQGGEAGTALRAIQSRLAALPSEAKKSLDTLGVATADAQGNLRDLPSIFQEISKAVDGMGSADKAKMMKNIFGMEALSAGQKLVDQFASEDVQNLTKALENAEGSALKMSDTMNSGMMANFDSFGSAFEGLMINIGSALAPTINSIVKSVTSVTQSISAFIIENQGLVSILGSVVIGLTAFKVVSLAGSLVFGSLKDVVLSGNVAFRTLSNSLLNYRASSSSVLAGTSSLSSGLATQFSNISNSARTSMTSAITSIRSLSIGGVVSSIVAGGTTILSTIKSIGLALVTNPLGLAITGLTVGATMIIRHFSEVKAFFSGFFDGFSQSFQPIFEQLSFLKPLVDGIGSAFGMVGNAVSYVFNAITSLFTPVQVGKEALDSATNAGVNFGKTVANAINIILIPLRWLIDGLGSVTNMVSNIGSGVVEKAKSIGNSISSFFGFGSDEKAKNTENAQKSLSERTNENMINNTKNIEKTTSKNLFNENNLKNQENINNLNQENIKNLENQKNISQEKIKNTENLKNINQENVKNTENLKNINQENIKNIENTNITKRFEINTNSENLKNVNQKNIKNFENLKNTENFKNINQENIRNLENQKNIKNTENLKNISQENIKNLENQKNISQENIKNFENQKNIKNMENINTVNSSNISEKIINRENLEQHLLPINREVANNSVTNNVANNNKSATREFNLNQTINVTNSDSSSITQEIVQATQSAFNQMQSADDSRTSFA